MAPGNFAGDVSCVWPRVRSCRGSLEHKPIIADHAGILRVAGLLILLFPRDSNVAGKDGVPEMGFRTKNGKLHGGIFLGVKDC